MKYVLLVHLGDEVPTDLDAEEEMRAYARLRAELEEEGVWLGGQALQPRTATTTVRVRGGDALVVDGPMIETTEVVAGYYLVDCHDLDEAIAVAARVPGARHGAVEVRPVFEYEALLAGGGEVPADPRADSSLSDRGEAAAG